MRPALYQKVTQAKAFSWYICEVFENIYFVEYLWKAVSELIR